MGYWLAPQGGAKVKGYLKRFDPRFWTINFPRPMMASVTTASARTLRVDAVFHKSNDLAGLIWESEDLRDHPLLAYETSRDYRKCKLSFRWRSGGIKALDAVYGPTLTIEGRDQSGAFRGWYVRLWNYASGSPEDATITLDFANLSGGFSLPGDADPVWAGDIDRMFISLVPPGYTGSDTPLAAPAEGWAEISEIKCSGSGSVLEIGDTLLAEHDLRIANGYDDTYHLTPARVIRNALHLGYRKWINHYVGMSHYFRLKHDGAGKFEATLEGGALNKPCTEWHRDFLTKAKASGYEVILSLSYELLDQHCPNIWKQRAENGDPALTGWDPPSALLSPANQTAMAYLQAVAQAFASLVVEAGQPVHFQVGEPWWWIMPDGRICLYDDAAKQSFGAALVSIPDVRQSLSSAQCALLDKAGELLSASTSALCTAVKSVAPDAQTLILVFLPTVLDANAPEVRRANVPLGWVYPAFDILQLEDYDWITAGQGGFTDDAVELVAQRLGYPVEEQHYFSGFALRPEDRELWRYISDAVEAGRKRQTQDIFLWALPQVLRDGFTYFYQEDALNAFDDLQFPIALGREASVEPIFSTAIVTSAGGTEQRNSEWADARLRFDVGPGIRSEAELETLISFFRARRGAAIGFRFQDPFDNSSNGMTAAPTSLDQLIGIGDGVRTEFPLIKRYGDQVRRVTRPVAGTIRISIGGVETLSGWVLQENGVIHFSAPVAAGGEVRAGFRFDVPVRFAEDRLSVNRATFAAGEIPSVPLVEIREMVG